MDIKAFVANENEKPLDKIVDDGGYTSILRTIGCVGDSLSSGEFESTKEDGNKGYHDYYDYSWGQFIARMSGYTVYNFSRGGMTAREYCNSFAENNGFWDKDKACKAYIIALGVNDVLNQGQPFGGFDDICLDDHTKNANTFIGRYGEIVQRLKEISPDAKFFFMTMPDEDVSEERKNKMLEHRDVMYKMAEFFDNSYVIDLMKYGPKYDAEFRKNFYLGGHMNACGYYLTAKMVASYIDYIIRHNMDDFRQIGFVGTPFKNAHYKF
ncbi:MAG: SGNH/GDSL hydrolase family protein [Clostridia bacterium]|nr:SGNH/GDSL hydrolase family protein [Clostridia bacterium]